MEHPIIATIIFSVIIGIVLVIINVVSALKNPEKYQKMTDDTYERINQVKENVKSNSISWEDAKAQAAAQLELEEKQKQERKAAKKALKNKNKGV